MSDSAALFKRYRRELFIATWCSYFSFYLCRKVYAVLKLPMKTELGLDDLQVAWPWTLYLIAYMSGQFFSAWLGTRVDSRRVLLAGMSVAALCNLALGWLVDSHVASAYLWICLTMIIHGTAQATGWPHNVSLFANWTQRSERGTLFSIWGTCYQIGGSVGKALAAFLLGWLGMAWSYFGSGLLTLAFTLLFYFWARERPEAVGLPAPDADSLHQATDGKSAYISGSTAEAATETALVARRWLIRVFAMGIIYFGFKFSRYALDSWSALILGERFNLTATAAGYWSTAYDWIGFLGVLAAGLWSDKMAGAKRTPVIFWMTFGCLLATTGMWWIGLDSVVLFIVFLGLIGFMAMGPDSLLSGTCAMDVGNRRQAAVAAGIINGVGSIGPIVQEPVIGWLKQTQGLSSVFGLLVGVVLLTTIGTGLLARAERGRL
jgi:sugar phosphate permease